MMKKWSFGAIKLLVTVIVCAMMLSLSAAGISTYRDVGANDWFCADVERMTENGLLKGYRDGSFRPNNSITCAEFVTIIARCADLEPIDGDVPHWAAGTMAAALSAGWYDWDEIPPSVENFDSPISRKLAVKVLMRALMPQVRGDYTTESAKIADFGDLDGRYYESVLAAYSVGVAKGDEQGRFNPNNSLTRAEACALIARAIDLVEIEPSGTPIPSESPKPSEQPVKVSGGVSDNGWLKVVGTQLCNEDGEPVVLHGMSTHGIQWFGKFAGEQSIKNTAEYGANVFRVAMYTAEGGYFSNKSGMKDKVIAAADAAIANDMYVIIDWHVLNDQSPSAHTTEAVEFFTAMAERYASSPAVIYEICNEPNGRATWAEDVKPYAETVIAAIREHSPNSVILIGSPTWSQDIHLAAADPVEGENLMYTLHFYAGTHGKELRDRIDAAMEAGLAIFVSEWGTSRADGSGGVFIDEATVWLDFLDERGISWCNWSLCDKSETSAALNPRTSADARWSEEDLSESGKFVFSRF